MIPHPSKLISGAREQSLNGFFGLAGPSCHLPGRTFVPIAPQQNDSVFLRQPGQDLPGLFPRQFAVKNVVKVWTTGQETGPLFGRLEGLGFAQASTVVVFNIVPCNPKTPPFPSSGPDILAPALPTAHQALLNEPATPV